MELALSNSQFTLMNENEMLLIDGGGELLNALGAVGGCVLIVAGAVSIIVGAGVAIGTGGAAVLPGIKLESVGVSAIIAGAKMVGYYAGH